jgi:pyruvate ferredoxin oxidoreductase beta subunit/2-oxoisovalerate ferredoxin oxidoreductase beta subunit
VVVTSAGCGSVVDGYYPTTASRVPFFHCSFGTAATTAAGVKAGLEMRGDLRTTVLAWAGDGGTFDIGLQSLSGAAERNENILYVCYDNEAYMNTGIQRSSATPRGALTTTTPKGARKEGPKKNMVAILAAHGIPYIATAAIAYPEDLEQKVRKARKLEGMKFIHVLSPCPPGWAYPPEKTVKLARLAVLSRIFPLLEVENGRAYRLSPMGEKTPVKEYMRLQGRFKSFTDNEMDEFQGDVDEAWDALLSLAARKAGSGRC